jgi:hypothetical protein
MAVVIVVSFQTVKRVLPYASGTVKHMVVENGAKNLDATTLSKVKKILTVSPMVVENVVRNRDAQMGHTLQDTVEYMVETPVRNRDAQLLPLIKPTIV